MSTTSCLEQELLEDRKGDAVFLRGGTLKTHKDFVGAWKDLLKGSTACCINLIIEKPTEDGRTKLIECRALKENVEDDWIPANCTEAAFHDVKELCIRLDAFALQCAKCRVQRGPELSVFVKSAIDRCARCWIAKRKPTINVDASMLPPLVTDDEGGNGDGGEDSV